MGLKTRLNHITQNVNLATTLATAFVVLSILSLLLASVLNITLNVQAQQQVVAAQQHLVADEAAKQVSGVIEQVLGTLEAATKIGRPFTISSAERQLFLNSLLELQPRFQTIGILDSEGDELVKVSRTAVFKTTDLVNLAESDLFKQVTQKQRYIGPLYIEATTQMPVVVVAVPIKNIVGEFEGALYVEVNFEFMWELVSSLKVGQTGVVYLVDREGRLIAFKETQRVLQGDLVNHLQVVSSFMASSSTDSEIMLADGIYGNSSLTTYVSLGVPDWAVVVELPFAEAYQPILVNVAVSAGGTLVVALLAGVSGLYLARRLAKPVLNLTQVATSIAAGELQLAAPVGGIIEISRLAVAFNSMTAQLRDLIQSLEERVKVRTHELALAKETAEEATRQTQVALHETEGLFRAVQSILGGIELKAICQSLTNHVNDLIQADRMTLYLVDHQHQEIILSVGHGNITNEFEATYEELKQGISGLVFQTKQPILSLHAEDGIEPEATISYRKRGGIGAIIVVPLVTKGQVIGTITAMNQVDQRLFTPHEMDLLTVLAAQAATAIENVRLYEMAQQELTERKRAQLALQNANEELARLNADKDKFFSIVAHDLKGPFTPLLGNSELLIEMADYLTPKDVKEMGASINRSGKRLLNLLENLLQWARMQMGRMEYDPEHFNLRLLTDGNVTLLNEVATTKKIELVSEVEDIWVFADKNMINTVIRNLTNNALKFTPMGGKVTIKGVNNALNTLEVAVIDTGIGIGPEDIAKLFKIDVHHSTSGTAQEKGTGLGLIMCKEMVEKNGGRIWVESELGKGTTVKFTVPMRDGLS